VVRISFWALCLTGKKAQTKLASIAKRVTNLREEFLHQV
jgi:hypothetical protein